MEQIYKQPGKRFRPFSQSAEVTCRGCSLTLQLAVTDFGADHSFGRVPDKLQEHYGITLPTSTVRNLTETHAQNMYDKNQQDTAIKCNFSISGGKENILQIPLYIRPFDCY